MLSRSGFQGAKTGRHSTCWTPRGNNRFSGGTSSTGRVLALSWLRIFWSVAIVPIPEAVSFGGFPYP